MTELREKINNIVEDYNACKVLAESVGNPSVYEGTTATAEDIALGKTAYSNGKLIEGTMEIKEDYNVAINTQIGAGTGTASGINKAITKIDGNLIVAGTSAQYMFRGCSSLETVPFIDLSSVTNTSYMFNDCVSLKSIPQLDTSSVTDFSSMFQNCSSLETIPLLNTSNVKSMPNLFNGCTSLKTIPQIDTSKVTTAAYMFSDCESLETIPELSCGAMTSVGSMFQDCKSLISIGGSEMNLSKATDVSYMFQFCEKLESLPALDMSKTTRLYYTFAQCYSLKSVTLTTTTALTNTQYAFQGCTALESVSGSIDMSKVTYVLGMFQGCTSLIDIPQFTLSSVSNSGISSMFNNCTNLSEESLNNILLMCTTAVKVTSSTSKTLKYIGLTEDQALTCTTLSNYQAFLDAGWTTGYDIDVGLH